MSQLFDIDRIVVEIVFEGSFTRPFVPCFCSKSTISAILHEGQNCMRSHSSSPRSRFPLLSETKWNRKYSVSRFQCQFLKNMRRGILYSTLVVNCKGVLIVCSHCVGAVFYISLVSDQNLHVLASILVNELSPRAEKFSRFLICSIHSACFHLKMEELNKFEENMPRANTIPTDVIAIR